MMSAIIPTFLMMFLLLAITTFTLVSPDASMGCYILGAEVNGDYSTEYLMIGNCL